MLIYLFHQEMLNWECYLLVLVGVRTPQPGCVGIFQFYITITPTQIVRKFQSSIHSRLNRGRSQSYHVVQSISFARDGAGAPLPLL
jgi:hypothetical protein